MKNNTLDAMFLGVKAENEDFFKDQLNFLMDEHIKWRKQYHPEDPPYITPEKKQTAVFSNTQERISNVLSELSEKLKDSSVPWFSPHYLGHMQADLLLPATLGYMASILYNPNNCSYEASPISSVLELEVGLDLAKMLGYDPDKAWGHITSGGTVANYEAIWLARNLKSIPLAVKKVKPELLSSEDEWSLLNMSTGDVLDLLDVVKQENIFEDVLKYSARNKGAGIKTGKLLVPKTRHYSWNPGWPLQNPPPVATSKSPTPVVVATGVFPPREGEIVSDRTGIIYSFFFPKASFSAASLSL